MFTASFAYAPAARKVTLLACELRAYANRRVAVEPADTLDRLSRDLRRIASAVGARRGRVEGVFGHRVLATFDGESRSFRALSAAAELLSGLSTKESAFEQADPPLIAITAGEAVTGSVVWEDNPAPAVVGLPVQQLESLLREATPGDLILSRDVHDELQETFTTAGVEVPAQRGVVSTQPLYVLRGDVAARVTGVEVAPTVSTAAPGAAAAAASPYTTLGTAIMWPTNERTSPPGPSSGAYSASQTPAPRMRLTRSWIMSRLSRISSSRSASRSPSSAVWSCSRQRLRSARFVDQSVPSKARRAASIARCMSARDASATSPRTSSVAGLTLVMGESVVLISARWS